MDLFVVNRFIGDNTKAVNTDDNNKLHTVLNKISKRQKRKLKVKNETYKIDTIQESELFKPTNILEENTNEENAISAVHLSNMNEIAGDELNHNEETEETTNLIDLGSFKILGTNNYVKKEVVKRVLPRWLRNPTVISTNLQKIDNKITQINLDEKIKSKLKENNIKYLFPVQTDFIPWQLRKSKESKVMNPSDVCVSAPTGSGKTLAFAIPVLQHLIHKMEQRNLTIKAVRVLLVLPTQSLAVQIFNAFKSYNPESNITVGMITSTEITFKAEQKLLVSNNSVWGSTSKVDIVVCTAGRLIDHIKNTRGFNLQYLEYVIIDEADRVLDSMQDDWLKYLKMHLREGENVMGASILTLSSFMNRIDPQKLLFSATLSSDPEKLEKLSLFQPKLFTCITSNENGDNDERFIGKYTTPNELVEKYTICPSDLKPLVLYRLITDAINTTEKVKIIVFVNDIDTGHRLSTLLCFMARKKFTIKEISNQTPKDRKQELLNSFSNGEINVLICSNLIARGIDIPNVNYVISYNPPTHFKTYVHRAGRTARGGMEGVCITLLEQHEERKFINMLKEAKLNICSVENIPHDQFQLEPLSPLYRKSLDKLTIKIANQKRVILRKTKQKKQIFKQRIK